MKAPTATARKSSYYLAGAIRGDTSYLKYQRLIRTVVSRYGEPYTERSENYTSLDPFIIGPTTIKEKRIFERDMNWLRKSRAVIAEVSGQSTGTGFEVAMSLDMQKPTLCLYHESSIPSLMIKQCTRKHLIIQEYTGEQDLEAYLICFMELVSRSDDDEIRRNYTQLSREVTQSGFRTAVIPERAQSLSNALHRP